MDTFKKIISVFLLSCSMSSTAETLKIPNYDQEKTSDTINLSIYQKNTSGKRPVIILLHGSSGIDDRSSKYIEDLLHQGYIVFEPDFKTGYYQGSAILPVKRINEMFLSVLDYVSKDKRVDKSKIAVIGWSMGGSIAIYNSDKRLRPSWASNLPEIKSSISLYPVCSKLLSMDFRGSVNNLLLLTGARDPWGDTVTCPWLIKEMTGNILHFEFDATHAWDRTFNSGQEFYNKQLKKVIKHEFNQTVTKESKEKIINFLAITLNDK